MAAVIYSSHGSYLAPADLMGGERGGRWVKVMIETERGRECLPSLAELTLKPEIGFKTVK